MFRPLLAVTALALTVSAPALAGGYSETDQPAVVPVPQVAAESDWTGFYAGLQFDLVGGTVEDDLFDADLDGHIVSAFLGYRYDLGRVVVGAEADIAIAGSGGMTYTDGGFVTIGDTVDYEITSAYRVGAELGYEIGPALAYVAAGVVEMDVTLANDIDGDGSYYGLGVDYPLQNRFVLGVEANWHQFEDFELIGNDVNSFTFGMNVAFQF